MINVLFSKMTAAKFATITPDDGTFYRVTSTKVVDGNTVTVQDFYLGNQKLNNADDLTSAIAALTADDIAYGEGSVKDILDTLLGEVGDDGSIAKMINDAITGLTGSATIATESNGVVTIKAGITETDGEIDNSNDSDITLAKVATTGAAEDVSNDAINGVTKDVNGTPTSTTNVQDTLEALKALIDAAGSDSTLHVVEGGASGDVLKSYTIYQGGTATVDNVTGKTTAVSGGTEVTTINIPKDYLVKGATVSTVTSTDKATGGKFASDNDFAEGDKYIDFTVNTKDNDGTATHLYINVNDLMAALSVESGASEVQLTLSATNQLSAEIVDVAASKVTYIAAAAQVLYTAEDDEVIAGTKQVGDVKTAAVARESVGAALARLDGDDTTTGSVAKKVKDAIGGLDAVADSTKTAVDGATARSASDGGVFALQAITEADGKISSMTAVEVDAAGAAAAVLGTNADDADDNTVFGAKAYTDSALTWVEVADN